MKAIIIQGLINYLYLDTDFQKAYIKRYNGLDMKGYKQSIKAFIVAMVYDGTIDYYELDKKYLDIAWLCLHDTIINLDNLYIDYENSIADDSLSIPFKPLSADTI
jgi:hypothetical protein